MEYLLEVANLIVAQSYSTVLTRVDELVQDEKISGDDKGKLYYYRAVASSELGDYDQALKDLDKTVIKGSCPNWLLRYGTAQFMTNDFANALISFKKAEEMVSDKSLKGTLKSWASKCELELGNPHVGNINDAIFIKADLPKAVETPQEDKKTEEAPVIVESGKSIKDAPHDWYQNTDFVFLSVLKKKITGDWQVVIGSETISITQADGEVISVFLANHVDNTGSSFTQTDKKVEIKLKKKDQGIQWNALSKEEISAKPKEVLPSYPTSNKRKANWNKLDREFEKELHGDKKDAENEDGLNDLFQQIYAGADEETKRAMIKSYQTSNGTVLSTNWDEVEKKDYEGKDYVAPPDDFVAEKPEY